jgi:acyl carrier protein
MSVSSVSYKEIETWLVCYLSVLLDLPTEDIDKVISFDEYGLDSAAAVGMTGAVEDFLELQIDPELVFEYDSITKFTKYVYENTQELVSA